MTTLKTLSEVPLEPLDLRRFEGVLSARSWRELTDALDRAGALLQGRTLLNVNSTPTGGGVAEMLQGLIAYVRGAGVDGRWLVIEGNSDFFAVTKRIHNLLHGYAGDGGSLGEAERKIYEDALAPNAEELASVVGKDDVVILHDPQTAGMVDTIKSTGATVLWRCHVGVDVPNDLTRTAWSFLRDYVEGADANVFSRQSFVWEGLDPETIAIIPPSINAFSPKNQDLDDEVVSAILIESGIVKGTPPVPAQYMRVEGKTMSLSSEVELVGGAQLEPDTRYVLQVSRWDRLKDPLGVIHGFADSVEGPVHLVLAGPSVEAVADDPEGKQVLEEVVAARNDLEQEVAGRVHLLALPMDDIQDNAVIVNALQRRATIVVQKSLAEGFGLTVAEAMWKARPVVASKAGGIQDQIEDGVSGVLLSDPRNLAEFGSSLKHLLEHPDRARGMGIKARERVREDFLHTVHLVRYLHLLQRLIGQKVGD